MAFHDNLKRPLFFFLSTINQEGVPMATKEVIETSEAEIAVHWGEEEYFHPSTDFIAQANMTDPAVFERFSLENFPNCFKEYADTSAPSHC